MTNEDPKKFKKKEKKKSSILSVLVPSKEDIIKRKLGYAGFCRDVIWLIENFTPDNLTPSKVTSKNFKEVEAKQYQKDFGFEQPNASQRLGMFCHLDFIKQVGVWVTKHYEPKFQSDKMKLLKIQKKAKKTLELK